ETGYKLTVIPFFQKVTGNNYQSLHQKASYYESNAYPVRSIKSAGGILVAGPDAPVETSDPRPFVNMARAVMRAYPGLPALNPEQTLALSHMITGTTRTAT